MKGRVFDALVIVCLFGSCAEVHARSFVSHPVPGARCGNGDQYQVFHRGGNTDRLLMVFQSGGACWDFRSCFGLLPLAKLNLRAPMVDGILSLSENNPFHNDTVIVFPYCTGDIYMGAHYARYFSRSIHHTGKSNLMRAVSVLRAEGVGFEDFKEAVVYGASAGALGVLGNLARLDDLLGEGVRKSAIVDSPGLHFSSKIWKRFSQEYLADLVQAFEENAMRVDLNEGVIAPQLRNFCAHFADWKIAFLQGARDFIMSKVFGDLSQREHSRLVYGSRGLWETLESRQDNCAAWIPSGRKHIFLKASADWNRQTSDGTTARAFLLEALSSRLLFESHR